MEGEREREKKKVSLCVLEHDIYYLAVVQKNKERKETLHMYIQKNLVLHLIFFFFFQIQSAIMTGSERDTRRGWTQNTATTETEVVTSLWPTGEWLSGDIT